MPEYTVVTEQVKKRRYTFPMSLPVDMGASTERLTDRMMRTAADEGNLAPTALTNELDQEETIVSIWRGAEQVWPRKRQRKGAAAEPFEDEPAGVPDDIDPEYEAAVADLRPEFKEESE